jgi:peroxiredoxin
MEEMPHLEKDVWQKFKDKGLVMVALGREHKDEELKEFQKKRHLTLPVASDPERKVYGLFATKYIPRNYLISADGKIAFQSVGYDQKEFAAMIAQIEKELGKAREAAVRQ